MGRYITDVTLESKAKLTYASNESLAVTYVVYFIICLMEGVHILRTDCLRCVGINIGHGLLI